MTTAAILDFFLICIFKQRVSSGELICAIMQTFVKIGQKSFEDIGIF